MVLGFGGSHQDIAISTFYVFETQVLTGRRRFKRRSAQTHREHQAPQRDLPGHGHVRPHQPPAEQRGQAGHDGDPGRRPVLGDGSGREVQVDVRVVEKIETSRSLQRKEGF